MKLRNEWSKLTKNGFLLQVEFEVDDWSIGPSWKLYRLKYHVRFLKRAVLGSITV